MKKNSTGTAKKRRSAAPAKGTRPATPKRPATRKKKETLRAAASFVVAARDEALDNLSKIDHIVVLMQENRSFDHMLGYLRLEGGRPEVDGLLSEMRNRHHNQDYFVRPLASTVFQNDPSHSASGVAEQLRDHNGGFVSSYAQRHPADDPGRIMGYYNGAQLPVYDHLARHFALCDRWFCSVPGATWPNRLYAAGGRAEGSKDNRKVPLYNVPSFVRHLDRARVSWRWYAHDIATLRLIDGQYRVGHFNNYRWFDRRTVLGRRTFLDHASTGELPAVSWIDPNFVDYSLTGPSESNDDHPPSDVMAGQDLVLKLYNAVINSPAWEKTLLVIIYDEHGGFFDHVAPPAAPDDRPQFRSYGLRVPAFVISPYAERGQVSHLTFDHTSLIKTILLRFCRRPDGSIPDMGARVNGAHHLGSLLPLSTPRAATPIPAYRHLIERVAQWRGEVYKGKTMLQAARSPLAPRELNEFQEGLIAAERRLRAEGLPEGQP